MDLRKYPTALGSTNGEERRVTTAGRPIGANQAMEPPLVSVVTITYNGGAHLERAMRSVFTQTYVNIEYIVVDGGSTDGSLDVIQGHAGRLSYWHSATDGGISDAFNRGVALSRGEFIGLVNSDDWLEPDQIEHAVSALIETRAPFVYGDLIYHNPDGSPAYKIHGDPDYVGKLWHRMPQVTHPTAVVRRSTYEQCGGFDPAWKIGMDYDWLCRLKEQGLEGAYCPEIIGHMSLTGISDRAWRACLDEHASIAIEHGSASAIILPIFAIRKVRISIRRLMAKIFGEVVVGRLRQALNPSYSPVEKELSNQ